MVAFQVTVVGEEVFTGSHPREGRSKPRRLPKDANWPYRNVLRAAVLLDGEDLQCYSFQTRLMSSHNLQGHQSKMPITPEQCRMARAGLHWSQVELSRRSGVAPATIAAFEKGIRKPYPRTIRDLETALVEAGIEFLNRGACVAKEPR